VVFQIPIIILLLSKLGIVTPQLLARNRRYAIMVIAVLAVLAPGTDPVTTTLIMLPMVLLFEFGILLARLFGRPIGSATPAAPSAQRQ
jgi:sec-independent protein translocase protein TatC